MNKLHQPRRKMLRVNKAPPSQNYDKIKIDIHSINDLFDNIKLQELKRLERLLEREKKPELEEEEDPTVEEIEEPISEEEPELDELDVEEEQIYIKNEITEYINEIFEERNEDEEEEEYVPIEEIKEPPPPKINKENYLKGIQLYYFSRKI